ncbi:hypothetical protein RZP29_12780 [Klebsiella quasipneumoniae subsp. similipneumoniae]|uniref:Uncharacterized protein n=1 Tax=Klebsiella quasipneumoniae subsp. similipneumoniae TaxID=1463164 RepID=A0AAE4MRN4_9ENTR|nr:hypothetical protein [Klebsiella quasipneumoniae]MDV0611490.1 hypothetical protein [Klebsiella quasipneumoniae subsp. similipneumoniae]MDV0641063.1 hypothetical protein [Klebsiella quasipneumoniae subsp. similipneumoniae]MDV0728219.1 hypothetical protein [Klebsiella quasipneumoniae subsp. similipneumoniae]MDV0737874.1 hypothetical protein [Klebsiella quasipneumoniae subsp. similipneumoniae]MDV0763659.1 hypothetical protein [Klebsiella quasipneumoniae subsp. similipneumoniae]
MTTDITELAQREKFEAWVITQICISKITLEGLRTPDGYRNSTLSGSDYNLMWNLWKAAGAELVEALEKAQAENTAGVAGMAESYETTISMLRSCIAELESRTVKLPHRNLGHPKLFLLCPFPYYDAEDMEKALAAAGIKVEAE